MIVAAVLSALLVPVVHGRIFMDTRLSYKINTTNPLKAGLDGAQWTAAMVCAPGDPDDDHSGEPKLPLIIYAHGWPVGRVLSAATLLPVCHRHHGHFALCATSGHCRCASCADDDSRITTPQARSRGGLPLRLRRLGV